MKRPHVHGVYRHKKTKAKYCVLGLVTNATNGDQEGRLMVRYVPEAYMGQPDAVEFVRNVEEFCDGRFTGKFVEL